MHRLPPSSPSPDAGSSRSADGADEAQPEAFEGHAAHDLHELHSARQLLRPLRDGRAPMAAALSHGSAADVRYFMALVCRGLDQRWLTPRDVLDILTGTHRHGDAPLHQVNVPKLADKLEAFFVAIEQLVRGGQLPDLNAFGLLGQRRDDGTTALQRVLQISLDQNVAAILVRLLNQQVRQETITPDEARALLLDREGHRVPGLERFLQTCEPLDAHRPFELRLEAVQQGLLTVEDAVSDLQAPADGPRGRPARDVLRHLFQSERASQIIMNLMDFLLALNRHEPLSPALLHRVLHRRPDQGGPLVGDLRHDREALEAYADGVIGLSKSPGLTASVMSEITGIPDLRSIDQVVADQRRQPAWLTTAAVSAPQRRPPEPLPIHGAPTVPPAMSGPVATPDLDHRRAVIDADAGAGPVDLAPTTPPTRARQPQ